MTARQLKSLAMQILRKDIARLREMAKQARLAGDFAAERKELDQASKMLARFAFRSSE